MKLFKGILKLFMKGPEDGQDTTSSIDDHSTYGVSDDE